MTGTETYLLASPLFPEATLHLQGGDLTISGSKLVCFSFLNHAGYGASSRFSLSHHLVLIRSNIYVQRCQLNGQEIDMASAVITFPQIKNGGHLEFWLGSSPVQ